MLGTSHGAESETSRGGTARSAALVYGEDLLTSSELLQDFLASK